MSYWSLLFIDRGNRVLTCPANTHSSVLGSDSERDCLECAAGRYSEPSTVLGCVPCLSGKYGDTNGGGCKSCPAGKSTNGLAQQIDCITCALVSINLVKARLHVKNVLLTFLLSCRAVRVYPVSVGEVHQGYQGCYGVLFTK